MKKKETRTHTHFASTLNSIWYLNPSKLIFKKETANTCSKSLLSSKAALFALTVNWPIIACSWAESRLKFAVHFGIMWIETSKMKCVDWNDCLANGRYSIWDLTKILISTIPMVPISYKGSAICRLLLLSLFSHPIFEMTAAFYAHNGFSEPIRCSGAIAPKWCNDANNLWFCPSFYDDFLDARCKNFPIRKCFQVF